METTFKRITLALTKRDWEEITKLSGHFGETQSQVIKRALILLHYITFTDRDKNNEFSE